MNALLLKQIIPNGDCALLLRFKASANRSRWIQTLATDFIEKPLKDLINVIPASDNLVLVFKQTVNHYLDWQTVIQQRIDQLQLSDVESTVHEILVCYEAQYAPDLNQVCEQVGLSREALIAAHTQPLYDAVMLGFLPGFTYLKGNDKRLCLPRKNTPAVRVSAGSVAVANDQTGLYALSSPGGWHVIGRSPTPLLNWHKTPANLIKPHDRVRFKSIDAAAFMRIAQSNNSGNCCGKSIGKNHGD
ncbi:carboxyltransferase domain-containing protein [Marinicella sp. S1101]|nr:carboxyltransferase domain-containing protein [Marinicella marina]MCX7554944.1 carboxyltransferase domain-containing protein [Marinicella marina]